MITYFMCGTFLEIGAGEDFVCETGVHPNISIEVGCRRRVSAIRPGWRDITTIKQQLNREVCERLISNCIGEPAVIIENSLTVESPPYTLEEFEKSI